FTELRISSAGGYGLKSYFMRGIHCQIPRDARTPCEGMDKESHVGVMLSCVATGVSLQRETEHQYTCETQLEHDGRHTPRSLSNPWSTWGRRNGGGLPRQRPSA